MATGKAAFAKVSAAQPVPPIPVFPKLPACLKRNRSDDDLRQIEEYEKAVEEFFKQQRQIGL